MRAVLVLVAVSVLATAPALADDDNTDGFYFGVGLGDFSTGVDDVSDVDEAQLDFRSGENAQKIFAGWRFNRFVALQIDRIDFERSVDARNALNVFATEAEDPIFGAGIGFTAERLNLRAEYEVVEIDGLDNPNAVWLTAAWRF